jgi:Mce-associated membrane protein
LRLLNGVLGVLLVALVATAAYVAVRGPAEDREAVPAAAASREYDDIIAAARQETEAFLTVDYKRMDPTVNRVLAGATGQFEKEYRKAEAQLRSDARRSKATSRGRVRAVGIGDLGGDSATVYVAGDGIVSNDSTGHEPQPRYYRFQLNMTKVGGRWLTADLRSVS